MIDGVFEQCVVNNGKSAMARCNNNDKNALIFRYFDGAECIGEQASGVPSEFTVLDQVKSIQADVKVNLGG